MRLKKTKIVATIGPACDDEAVMREMMLAGVDVVRLNLSHGQFDEHVARIEKIRAAATATGAKIAIMADTRGREIRTGELDGGSVLLERGQEFALLTTLGVGNAAGVSISHATLHQYVQPGQRVLLDDGRIELRVLRVAGDVILCRVEDGGMLRNRKGVNLPDTSGVFEAMDSDVAGDLEFAAANGVDYVAASFINTAADIVTMRDRLRRLGADTPIIAKIESRGGVENLASIIEVADGAMVARGDLGVEIDLAQGPIIQKRIIRMTVTNGKPVITATQMLDSMERNPRPTRAEVSDVANAILDGSSAVMLSGETAVGAYPIQAVKTMVRLALEAEAGLRDYGFLQQILPHPANVVTEAIAQASITMANHLKAGAIIALTETGFTSRQISKYRPDCHILAVTSSPTVERRLALNWGVLPIHFPGERDGDDEAKIAFAIAHARSAGYLRLGDIVVVTAGSHRQSGSTDLIRVLTVK
ncbi:MAG: pyruvate kinase [Gammaproteobacteria bacterium]|nr:pyruvate kinase [Gammaproteobacteria bacterium]